VITIVMAAILHDHNFLVVMPIPVTIVVSVPVAIVMPVLLYDDRVLRFRRSDGKSQGHDAQSHDRQNEIAHFISSMVARCSTQTSSKPFHEQIFIAADFEGTISSKSGLRFSGGEWGG
jgi:hypothetical protein